MERTQAVGAVVFRKTGEVLLVRRGRPPAAGSWTIPGGRVEPGEEPAEAIVREIREETALEVRVERFLGMFELDGEGYAYTVHEHLCTAVDDDAPIRAGDDAADVRWFDPSGLAALGVRDEARDLIARARAFAARR